MYCSSTTDAAGLSKSSLCRAGRMYIRERRYGLQVQTCAFTTEQPNRIRSYWSGNQMIFGVLMLCHCRKRTRKRTRKETRRKPAALAGCFSRQLKCSWWSAVQSAGAKTQSCQAGCVISPVLCDPLNVSWSCLYLVSLGNLELQHFEHQISQSYTVLALKKRNPLAQKDGWGYQVAWRVG